jgi:hypothetical protein
MQISRIISVIVLIFTFFFSVTVPSFAVVDPLAVPNNKFGIHILFHSELEEAAKLVNSNGGEWGYVTIPIQSGDRDIEKWQKFMDECKRLKLIPLVRLATEGDYFNTHVWRKPNASDILDFANFLNSLQWPTKNRYVIVFNEVNRGDEWGGSPNPEEYADILSYAVTVFKSKSHDFFMISAGLDNAAPNRPGMYMNQYVYMGAMHDAVPGIFNQIDGLSSHSYPNPAFAQPPSVLNAMSIASFFYERDYAQRLSNKKLPVFITETGWTDEKVSDDDRARYYDEALKTIWADEGIVTIAPFLLRAGGGNFKQFSFLTETETPTKQYDMIKNLQKVKGEPELALPVKVLGVEKSKQESVPVKFFVSKVEKKPFSLSESVQAAFKWMMKII